MNKNAKLLGIIGIVFGTIIVGIIGFVAFVFILAFSITGNIASADEYTLGEDVIPSIKYVVEERKVVSASTEIKNGVTIKIMEFESDSVQEDLLKYVLHLRESEDFYLTNDMDLSIIPGTIQMAKQSVEDNQIVMLNIEYSAFGYIIEIQKGEGTLNLY